MSASAIDGKGVLGEIGEPPTPSDLYDDGSDGSDDEPASEPSDEWDDSGWWDTGDWGDADAVYGCDAPDFGICYDHYSAQGWDQDSAMESCDYLTAQYGISTTFLANPGCPTSSAVGECDLPAGGDFTYGITALYDSGSWDSGSAEGACGSAGGSYFGF